MKADINFIWLTMNIWNKQFNSRCVNFLWELIWFGESSLRMLFNAYSPSSHEVSNFIRNMFVIIFLFSYNWIFSFLYFQTSFLSLV